MTGTTHGGERRQARRGPTLQGPVDPEDPKDLEDQESPEDPKGAEGPDLCAEAKGPEDPRETQGYVPAVLPEEPLCIPLPRGWFDDLGYKLSPYAYAGCARPPGQFGSLGTCTRAEELIATNLDGCFAHAFFGTPESGKSYIQGVYVESALIKNRYQGCLPDPLCVISFGFGRHGGGSHLSEQLSARYANKNPAEVHALIHEHGTLPEGVSDVVGLTVSGKVEEMRRRHPHCQVLGLKFPCRQLGIDNLKKLMIMSDKVDSLLAAEISDMVDSLPRDFTKKDLIEAARTYPFRNRSMRRLADKRLQLACKLIDDSFDVRGLLRPGRLIAVEIRDPWLSWTQAMKLFQIMLDVLVMGEGEAPCNLLLCIDEAHKFLEDPGVRRQVEHIIKERRHLGISVVLSSQDPMAVPHSTLAELDGVGLFRTDSERFIKHLAKDFVAFRELSARDTAALLNGQMFFWSQKWFVPDAPGSFDGHLIKVQVRPRLSHHGGATRTAAQAGHGVGYG